LFRDSFVFSGKPFQPWSPFPNLFPVWDSAPFIFFLFSSRDSSDLLTLTALCLVVLIRGQTVAHPSYPLQVMKVRCSMSDLFLRLAGSLLGGFLPDLEALFCALENLIGTRDLASPPSLPSPSLTVSVLSCRLRFFSLRPPGFFFFPLTRQCSLFGPLTEIKFPPTSGTFRHCSNYRRLRFVHPYL